MMLVEQVWLKGKKVPWYVQGHRPEVRQVRRSIGSVTFLVCATK